MTMLGVRTANMLREGRRALPAIFPRTFRNWREERYYARYGEIELHLAAHLCLPDRDAIDVGANDGCYVHVLRKCARRVYAFEPLPWLAQTLRTKFRRDIFHRKVIIAEIALSDSRGTNVLRVPILNGLPIEGCSSMAPGLAAKHPVNREVRVHMDALDNLNFGEVGFIKIDVEGYEEAVLAGARKTIVHCQPRLQVEIVEEAAAPGAVTRIADWFRGLGYRGYFIYQHTVLPIEKFDAAAMQNPANYPDLTAGLDKRERFGTFIYNFLFFPCSEPPATLRHIGAHVARL